MTSDNLPRIWLRSFFGFLPEEDGYIGWSQEANRAHILSKASPGDLMMIYGAWSASTSSSDILRVLGFLQIETSPHATFLGSHRQRWTLRERQPPACVSFRLFFD